VAFGWIAMAGALWPPAPHHSFQDRAFQKILDLEKVLSGLAEALRRGASDRRGGRFSGWHDVVSYSYSNNTVDERAMQLFSGTFWPEVVTFPGRSASSLVWD
jgi:hypothetical protein